MKTLTTATVGTLLLVAIASSSRADDSGLVRWKRIIGIEQAGNVVGNPPNTVTGGGQPWSALDGEVEVTPSDGGVEFDVRASFSPAAIRSARRTGSLTSKGPSCAD